MAMLKYEWFLDFTWKIHQDDGVVWVTALLSCTNKQLR